MKAIKPIKMKPATVDAPKPHPNRIANLGKFAHKPKKK